MNAVNKLRAENNEKYQERFGGLEEALSITREDLHRTEQERDKL